MVASGVAGHDKGEERVKVEVLELFGRVEVVWRKMKENLKGVKMMVMLKVEIG